jgi:ATP-binding cassette subfamily C protein/ATP-binding cassette subfamily C protein LapB
LVKKPAILLLDDPADGLDWDGDAAFIAYLSGLRGKTTVVLVTERPSHMRVADRVIWMRDGMVVADSSGPAAPTILKQINSTTA